MKFGKWPLPGSPWALVQTTKYLGTDYIGRREGGGGGGTPI